MKLDLKFTSLFLIYLFLWVASPAQQLDPLASKSSAPASSTSTKSQLALEETSASSFVKVSHSLPEIPREFRGVWIATVANIDWPASGTDTWENQKKDYVINPLPGTEISSSVSYSYDSAEHRFEVISIHFKTLDVLELSPDGHRRAKSILNKNGREDFWLAP